MWANQQLRVTITLAICLMNYSCTKIDGFGDLQVTIKNNNRVVSGAFVYVKYGTTVNPNIPLSRYDRVNQTNSSGKASFSDLPAQRYYIFCTAFDRMQGLTIIGEGTVQVRERFRLNEYEIIIEAK